MKKTGTAILPIKFAIFLTSMYIERPLKIGIDVVSLTLSSIGNCGICSSTTNIAIGKRISQHIKLSILFSSGIMYYFISVTICSKYLTSVHLFTFLPPSTSLTYLLGKYVFQSAFKRNHSYSTSRCPKSIA